MFKKIITTILSILLITNFVNAQTKLSCPSYTFVRDLSQGSTGADVRLLQEILNADYRTQIAPVGSIGSPGRETANFQVATRESVKRFQALFIELIGIANGKVGPKTRIVLNSVCQGPYFTNGTGGIHDGISTTTTNTNTDKTAPVVNLNAPNSSFLGENYRVYVYASEPVNYPTAESFIVDGGAILSDIRKEGPSTYKVLVTPTQTATHTIKIQMEADAIVDLAGNKSTYASNEVSTLISPAPAGPDTTSPSITLQVPIYIKAGQSYRLDIISDEEITTPTINDFITTGGITLSDIQKTDDKNYSALVSSSNTGTYTATVQMLSGKVFDKSGNKNNTSNLLTITVLPDIDKILSTSTTTTATTQTPAPNFDNSSEDEKDLDPMQLLMMALSGINALKGLLGGSLSDVAKSLTGSGTPTPFQTGGIVTAPSPCACAPTRSTILLTPTGSSAGTPGFYFKELNPTVQPSCFVSGFVTMVPASPINVCGQASAVPSKKGCPTGFMGPGVGYQGCCLEPQNNFAGQPVVGTFPPPSTFFRGCGI